MKQKLLRGYYRILVAFAHHYLKRHQAKVIGINGSVGKTSCRMIIYQTLQHFFPNRAIYTSPKNFNGELGLPLSVFCITDREPNPWYVIKTFFKAFSLSFFGKKKYDSIILEYGIDRPGEMDFILKVAHPDIGVFTAIDAVHSEQFGTPDEIAKEEIKMALNTKELIFLNQDDSYAMQLLPRIQIDKISYQTKGYDQTADISFSECTFNLGDENHEIKSVFSLNIKGKQYQITTNLIGKANYGYIGVALAIAETIAYQSKDKFHLPKKLEIDYELQPGRLSIFAGKYDSIIFDSTYNAAPLSMRKTIDTAFTIRASLFPNSEIWLILGDMRELGDLTEKEHRLLAGYVSQVADKLFLMGEQMTTHLADEIQKVGFNPDQLFLTKKLKDLNTVVEKELKKSETSTPLLVFKGGQNTIFLEESVKHFLKHSSDEKFLTRQGDWWNEKKKKFL